MKKDNTNAELTGLKKGFPTHLQAHEKDFNSIAKQFLKLSAENRCKILKELKDALIKYM